MLGFSPCYQPSMSGTHNPRSEPGYGWSGQAARNRCTNSFEMQHIQNPSLGKNYRGENALIMYTPINKPLSQARKAI